jgi:hypothetical protein
MVFVLIILMGLLAGWRFGRRRTVLFLPTLSFGLIQAGHLVLSATTNTLANSTLLPVVMGSLWLAAAWLGATVHAQRATR